MINDRSFTYHGVRRQTDRLMNDTDQVDVLPEVFGAPGAGFHTREDPSGAPMTRTVQTHTDRVRAFAPLGPAALRNELFDGAAV